MPVPQPDTTVHRRYLGRRMAAAMTSSGNSTCATCKSPQARQQRKPHFADRHLQQPTYRAQQKGYNADHASLIKLPAASARVHCIKVKGCFCASRVSQPTACLPIKDCFPQNPRQRHEESQRRNGAAFLAPHLQHLECDAAHAACRRLRAHGAGRSPARNLGTTLWPPTYVTGQGGASAMSRPRATTVA